MELMERHEKRVEWGWVAGGVVASCHKVSVVFDFFFFPKSNYFDKLLKS